MSLIDDVDLLYEGCVMEPHRWSEQSFVDWADAASTTDGIDRTTAKSVRRCLNAARRLASFWATADLASAPDDWRARVDVALGVRAWRPQLELAEALLERDPRPEHFDRVSALFKVVTNQPFLDGIDYEAWREDRTGGGAGGTIAP